MLFKNHRWAFQPDLDTATYASPDKLVPESDYDKANLITSLRNDKFGDVHSPILDIDFGAQLVPSSTSGHYHLYLDKKMSWEQYKKLLIVLAEVGVIEKGYADCAIKRGFSTVRRPGDKKKTP